MPDQSQHRTWVDSDRPIPRRFVRPALRFTHVEASGGVVLLIAAIVALLWANAPFGESYDRFWDTHLTFEVGSFHFDESLRHFVNDALMTLFFFVVGMEIKRELAVGELRDPKRAALPAVAALGGMALPALIYVAFVAGTGGEAMRGWGIPMATDIAFSVGVISLLGRKVSLGAKLFLLALAIADDIGAIIVIAVFYTSELSLLWLLIAIGGLVAVYVATKVGIRSTPFYIVLGTGIWFCVFESGVHATLAGVALGLLAPPLAMYSDDEYHRRARWLLGRYEMDSSHPQSRARLDQQAMQVAAIARESVPPLDRLVTALHPWTSFVVVPLFALANAGVRFEGIGIADAATHPVALGVGLGLLVGKIVGITGATFLAVKLGIGKLPRRTGWNHVIGLAGLAGIGFTVSLFVTELAFTDAFLADRAKIGIFAGSLLAGIIGYVILRAQKTPQEAMEDAHDAGTDYVDADEDYVGPDVPRSGVPEAVTATGRDGPESGD